MDIGSKVSFAYKNRLGTKTGTSLFLSNSILSENEMSDAEVKSRLCISLQKVALANLISAGYIFAARNLLKVAPDATEIEIREEAQKKSSGGGDSGAAIGILAALALIVAIICFPLLVMLGMHGKLFLKGFYNKCEGDKYTDFVKKYTLVGIGLYALTILLFAIDIIFKLNMLSGPAFGILFVGGIAYFVGSLLIVKKKFLGEEHSFNFIETIKNSFKKVKK